MLIDIFAPDCLGELRNRASILPPEYTLYVLIDGAFREGMHKIFAEKEKRILFDSLPSCSAKTRDVSPFLIEFNPIDQRFRLLLERCSGWPMVSAIETAECLSELSLRLATWCVVEADGDRFNFRFSDTRRIPAIFGVLTSEQRAHFLGPAANWSYIGRDGKWKRLDGREQPRQPDLLSFDPSLNKSQFITLLADSRADEILSVIAYRGEKLNNTPSQIWNSIIAALEISATANLTEADTVEWAIWSSNNDHDKDETHLQARLQAWLDKKCEFRSNKQQEHLTQNE